MKILIIEDCKIDQIIDERMIHQYDPTIEIVKVSSTDEGIQYLLNDENQLPRIILLDIFMDPMGWKFLDFFDKSLFSHQIRLYILSSSSDLLDKQKAGHYTSVKNYFVKPLQGAMIQEMLSNESPKVNTGK